MWNVFSNESIFDSVYDEDNDGGSMTRFDCALESMVAQERKLHQICATEKLYTLGSFVLPFQMLLAMQYVGQTLLLGHEELLCVRNLEVWSLCRQIKLNNNVHF